MYDHCACASDWVTILTDKHYHPCTPLHTTHRKQCLHCGCSRSSHSVESEPSSIVPLLEGLTVGTNTSKLTRADMERLAKYAWYPPGVSYGMVREL